MESSRERTSPRTINTIYSDKQLQLVIFERTCKSLIEFVSAVCDTAKSPIKFHFYGKVLSLLKSNKLNEIQTWFLEQPQQNIAKLGLKNNLRDL